MSRPFWKGIMDSRENRRDEAISDFGMRISELG